MNVQQNLQEIAEAFGATYGALDIRTAAVRHGDSWVNVLTVIRVSYEPSKIVTDKHQDLKMRHILPEMEDFRIFLSSKDFSAWPSVCTDLGLKDSARIMHDGTAVKLASRLDIFSKTGYVNRHHNILREAPEWGWPTCEIGFDHRPTDAESLGLSNRLGMLSDSKLNQKISQFGHSNIFEAIDAFLELACTFMQNSNLEFYVSLPIFAAIDAVKINPVGNTLTASARFHPRLPDIRFFAVCKDSPSNTGLRPKATLLLQIDGAQGEIIDGVRKVCASVVLPSDIHASDYVEVKVVSTLGDIDIYNGQIHALQPTEHVHAFYHALTAFCSEAELRQALVYPQARQLPKSQPWKVQDYFERSVCWLLSFFGFSSIMLGEYETLRIAGSNFQRGSLDILAFNPIHRLMLIVGCTLNAPKDEDFTNLLTLRTIFTEEIFTESALTIRPVVFTGLRTFSEYWEPISDELNLTNSTIPIFDGSRTENALDLLAKKQEHEFFNFLINPH
jgi:hypothetical protein